MKKEVEEPGDYSGIKKKKKKTDIEASFVTNLLDFTLPHRKDKKKTVSKTEGWTLLV